MPPVNDAFGRSVVLQTNDVTSALPNAFQMRDSKALMITSHAPSADALAIQRDYNSVGSSTCCCCTT
jgi:hypothetical protein